MIIVGGGVSGLGAAHALSLIRCDVVLLEAREALGGRTRSITAGAFAGQDEGAHWVHGGLQNLVTKPLFDAFNLTMRPTHGDEIYQQGLTSAPAWLADGTQLKRSEILSSYEAYEALSDRMAALQDERARTGLPDMTIGEAFSRTLNATTPPPGERELALLSWHFTFEVEGDDGADVAGPRGLSLDDTYGDWPYTDFYTEGKDGRPRNHDYVPSGGYGSLVDAFAARLHASPTVEIRCGRSGEVVEMSSEGDRVAIRTRDGGVVNGSHVLVTVPLGVLQQQPPAFSPPLPQQRIADIASVQMGVLDKVMLRWDSAFWPRNTSGFGYVAPAGDATAGTYPVALNSEADNEGPNTPTLTFLVGGSAARRLERSTDTAITEQALSALRAMFGREAVPPPRAVHVTRWLQDRFTYGAYSFVPFGSTAAAMRNQSTPLWGGHLRFAGEATCYRMYATVHGAYASAMREVSAMLEATGGKAAFEVAAARWPLLQAVRRFCEHHPQRAGDNSPDVPAVEDAAHSTRRRHRRPLAEEFLFGGRLRL